MALQEAESFEGGARVARGSLLVDESSKRSLKSADEHPWGFSQFMENEAMLHEEETQREVQKVKEEEDGLRRDYEERVKHKLDGTRKVSSTSSPV